MTKRNTHLTIVVGVHTCVVTGTASSSDKTAIPRNSLPNYKKIHGRYLVARTILFEFFLGSKKIFFYERVKIKTVRIDLRVSV